MFKLVIIKIIMIKITININIYIYNNDNIKGGAAHNHPDNYFS